MDKSSAARMGDDLGQGGDTLAFDGAGSPHAAACDGPRRSALGSADISHPFGCGPTVSMGATFMIIHDAPHGMCSIHKDLINVQWLRFLQQGSWTAVVGTPTDEW